MLCSTSVLRLRDYLVLLRHCGSSVKKKTIPASNLQPLAKVLMVSLEGVLRSGTPPQTLPSLMGMKPNSYGHVQDCPAVPGMVQVNGCPPFQIQQGLPLQHYTMVYSMRSNQQQPRERTRHGQATIKQT